MKMGNGVVFSESAAFLIAALTYAGLGWWWCFGFALLFMFLAAK